MSYAMRALSEGEIDHVAGAGLSEAIQAVKEFIFGKEEIIVPGTDENGNIIGSKEAEEAKKESDDNRGGGNGTGDTGGDDTGGGGSGSG